uniref:Uncharacterized protein n=1 Tax=Caenorhabditis japonica TaxID=281687 RepID=A0A8R1E993_CAEJA
MVADNSEKSSTKSVANGSLISTVSCKDELPNAIIVTQVPEDVFDNTEDKANFSSLFTAIEKGIHFDFLRSFRRVRVIFRLVTF